MKLIFASHNAHKASEIQSILPSWIEITTLSELNYMDEIPENEATIEGNSQFKASFVHQKFEQNCFADDTGYSTIQNSHHLILGGCGTSI